MAVNHRPQPNGSLVYGVKYDSIKATYPNNTTEIYEYYYGGLSGEKVATVTVIYTSKLKEFIDTVVRT